jgi:hypothetical protein
MRVVRPRAAERAVNETPDLMRCRAVNLVGGGGERCDLVRGHAGNHLEQHEVPGDVEVVGWPALYEESPEVLEQAIADAIDAALSADGVQGQYADWSGIGTDRPARIAARVVLGIVPHVPPRWEGEA